MASLASCFPVHSTVCSNASKIRCDLQALEAALREYSARTGVIPRSWDEMIANPPTPRALGVAEPRAPLDPWKQPYLLLVSADQRSAVIGCLGRDAVPGGSDEDADCWSAMQL